MSFLARLFQPRLFSSEAASRHSLLTWDEGCVQAGVVRLNNGSAELLGVANSLVSGLKRDGNPDMDCWGAGSEQALNQAEEMTHLTSGARLVPNNLAIGIPADLVHSLPITVTRNRRGQDEPIGKMEIQALLERGFREAHDIVDRQDSRAQIVYGTIGQFALDGQVVPDPLGLHGSELDASLCFSLIPLEWLRATQKLAQQLMLQVSMLVPEQVALASPLTQGQAWLIVLARHHTMLALVNQGSVVWCSKIAIGERDIVGEVGKIMAMQGREVDVLMRTYRDGRLSEEAENRLARAFWFQLRRWMTALANEAVLALNSNIRVPPRSCYWLDQTNSMPEAGDALQTPVWSSLLPFESDPVITRVASNSLHDVLDCTAQANNPTYLPLRALAMLVARTTTAGNVWGRHLMQIVRGRRA